MTPRTDLTANELCEILNGGNNHGCNQYGCKAGAGVAQTRRRRQRVASRDRSKVAHSLRIARAYDKGDKASASGKSQQDVNKHYQMAVDLKAKGGKISEKHSAAAERLLSQLKERKRMRDAGEELTGSRKLKPWQLQG